MVGAKTCTDDQDSHMKSLDYMPEVQKYLVTEGATFENHFCTGKLPRDARILLSDWVLSSS